MQFVSENYVWFIIALVVIIMTIIGYIAEKTDFGHKKVEVKEKKSKNRIDEIKNSNLKLNEAVYNNVVEPVSSKENLEIREENINNEPKEVDIFDFNEPKVEEKELSKEEIEALSVPIEAVNLNTDNKEIENEPKKQDNNAKEELPIMEENNGNDEPVVEHEIVSDDDIWKF